MRNKVKIILSFFLALTFVFSCFAVQPFAADSEEILAFRVSDDGFAIVYDCNTAAVGTVSIPPEVEIDGKVYEVRYIGERAFDKCYYVSEIIIPEGVTAIRSLAFRDCISLANIYIPESLIVCQYDAFDGCTSVTVHCYKSNYQFFTIFGISANIIVDIIDEDNESEVPDDGEEPAFSDNFVIRFFEALKKMVNSIVEYFNSQDDFQFELPFDLPFDIEGL